MRGIEINSPVECKIADAKPPCPTYDELLGLLRRAGAYMDIASENWMDDEARQLSADIDDALTRAAPNTPHEPGL